MISRERMRVENNRGGGGGGGGSGKEKICLHTAIVCSANPTLMDRGSD